MSIQTADVHFFNNIINMYRYSYSLSALHIVSCLLLLLWFTFRTYLTCSCVAAAARRTDAD